jgi:hypothetical protein
MTYVITFKGLRPSSRTDGIKWTLSTIEESAPSGTNGDPTTWATVESFPIADYPDPASPPTFDRTTDLATLLPGWYRVRFNDPGAGVQYTSPRYFDSELFRPSTRMVAAYIKNRTVDSNNNYLGDFTSATVVTDAEVEELITVAKQRVLRKLDADPNEPIPVESHLAITSAIALYTAMLVELTKFSEQIQTNRSPYPHLFDLWKEMWPDLVEDVTGVPPTDTSGGSKSVWDLVATQSNTAHYAFPDPATVNWETAF